MSELRNNFGYTGELFLADRAVNDAVVFTVGGAGRLGAILYYCFGGLVSELRYDFRNTGELFLAD